MQILRCCAVSISLFLLSGPASILCLAKTAPALAVLSQIQGGVKAGFVKKMTAAHNGKMLWHRYRVQTGEQSRATIFFADGSKVRLFSSTELTIGAKKSRSFRWSRYRLVLRSGSLWGYFVRGERPVEMLTGTLGEGKKLRLLMSDAAVSISKKKTGIDIAVSSGSVKVNNPTSSIKLQAGQRLYQIQKDEFLPQKVSLVPNQLKLRIEPDAPIFSGKETLKLNLYLQVVRFGSDRPAKRSGPVRLSSDYYNLTFPDAIHLNSNGEAKIVLNIAPPRLSDRTYQNTVKLHAIMDQSGYDDVQNGFLKVKFAAP